jgi:hypothetical protein
MRLKPLFFCLGLLSALVLVFAGQSISGSSAAAEICRVDIKTMLAPGCRLLRKDTAAQADPRPGAWGNIECQQNTRHKHLSKGGARHKMANNRRQQNTSYRKLRVIDGDDFYGERCELGRNEHRYGQNTRRKTSGAFALYKEGQRKLTFISYRLPANFPLHTDDWQAVMQMKQTQPSNNGNGTPVISLDAHRGQWRLYQSASAGPSNLSRLLWSAPATKRQWTRFAFDVRYSQDPNKGRIKVYADLNNNGTFADPGEQSPLIKTYTLKKETAPSSSGGIPVGQSIPSHLRLGIYHNPKIDCPRSGGGCSVDVDNVQVMGK